MFTLLAQVFKLVVSLPPNVYSRYKNDLILEAACNIIANTLSPDALQVSEMKTLWRDLVGFGFKSPEIPTQEAAALAMRAYSEVTDCHDEVDR